MFGVYLLNLIMMYVILLQIDNLNFNFEIIVVTYEIRVFFEGAQKEVFSSIFKKAL